MIYRFIKIMIGFYINLIISFLFKNLAALPIDYFIPFQIVK